MSTEQPTQTQSEPAASQSATPAAVVAASPSEAVAVERPAYIPESFWDAEAKSVKADDFAKHLETLAATQSEVDARKAGVPEAADKYVVALPEGAELPEGMSFLDDSDPLVVTAREFAHKNGLSQEMFSGLVAMHVQTEAQRVARDEAAAQAQIQALGEKATERMDAVSRFLDGVAPTPAHAALVNKMVTSKLAIELFEGLQQKMSSQGIDPLKAGGNERQVGRTEEEWGSMTPSQRLASTWKPAARG